MSGLPQLSSDIFLKIIDIYISDGDFYNVAKIIMLNRDIHEHFTKYRGSLGYIVFSDKRYIKFINRMLKHHLMTSYIKDKQLINYKDECVPNYMLYMTRKIMCGVLIRSTGVHYDITPSRTRKYYLVKE